MSNSNDNKYHDAMIFDPLAIFPARVKDRVFEAHPLDPVGVVGGACNVNTGVAYLPMGNNYYDRNTRAHEAKHAIYTEPRPAGTVLTCLDQAMEDARIESLANYKVGETAREDQVAAAEFDLKQTISKQHAAAPKALKALITLRSAAIFMAHDAIDITANQMTLLNKACDVIDPSYSTDVARAVRYIQKGKMAEAEALMLPYFGTPVEEPEKPKGPGPEPVGPVGQPGPKPPEEGQGQPGPEPPTKPPKRYKVPREFPEDITRPGKDKVKSKEDKVQAEAKKKLDEPVPELEVEYQDVEGKLTNDSIDLLSGAMIGEIGHATDMPRMKIVPLYAHDMVKTTVGHEMSRNTVIGSRIDTARLASRQSNPLARVFVRQARVNGGSILIDASGSMALNHNRLKQIIDHAPLATIAFYNGDDLRGHLWVYAYKSRRAASLDNVRGWKDGNEIDFQALQWLLQQDRPRLFLTDGGFCGCSLTSCHAAIELFKNALARKKVTQARSFQEMLEVLKKGLR